MTKNAVAAFITITLTTAALMTGEGAFAADQGGAPTQAKQERSSFAQRTNCQAENHGPRVERDQTGFWVDYGVKYYCDKPEEFSLRVTLQQHTGDGWIAVDSESFQGVSMTPFADGGVQCRHETNTTYRFTVEGHAGGLMFNHNGPVANLPCSL